MRRYTSQVPYYNALFSQDFESLYALSIAANLRAETRELLGKIYMEIGETEHAYNCFCGALNACSDWYFADFELFTMSCVSDWKGLDTAISNYITEIREQEELDNVRIESFDYNIENGTFTDKRTINVHKNAKVATILTNRAQCGVFMGLVDESETDCLTALDIWNSLDFSERINISYTNNVLIVTNISRLVTGTDSALEIDDEQKEVLNKMLDYANESVTYDFEIYGENHWRIARSYEMRATIYTLLGYYESALEDYQKAYNIYLVYGDELGLDIIGENINRLQNIE